MNPEENSKFDSVFLKIRLLDDESEPNITKNAPKFTFKGYHIKNLYKMEWVVEKLIEMGFQKADIIQIINSNEIHDHEDNGEDMIFNYVLMMILEIPPGKSNIDFDSEENISLLIKSQIREKKEEKINENVSFYQSLDQKDQIYCGICFSSENKFEIMPKCKHQFCDECFMEYLIYSIENDSQKLLNLPCPENTCNNKLPLSFIEKKLTNNEPLLIKFNKFIKMANFSKDRSYRPCIKPNCENYVKKRFFSNKTKCSCGQIMCFKCQKPWHEGEVCRYGEDQNELDFIGYQKNKNTKICPKCQIIIEKNLGCNHMKCIKCSHEFCWVCSSNWVGGCPKKCPQYPQEIIPDGENLRVLYQVEDYLRPPIQVVGWNKLFKFLVFYINPHDFGCFYYYFLLLPYLICQILGFVITLSLMIIAILAYIYGFMVWLVYYDSMKELYDKIGNLYDAGFLKASYFIFLMIFRFPFNFIDSFLTIPFMFFWLIIMCIRHSCMLNTCWFLTKKLNYNLFKTFCFLSDPNHQIYTGRNHAFEGLRHRNPWLMVFLFFWWRVSVIILIIFFLII